MRTILFSSLAALLLAAGCGSDSSSSGSSGLAGTACGTVSDFQCEGDILYRCHFDADASTKTWEQAANCAGSSTAGCHCGSSSGYAMCMTADNQGACEGT